MKIVETAEFVRAKERGSSPAVWNLTNLDRACLPMVLRGTWIFEGRPDIERMKAGLQTLLGHYPHLAGRMKDAAGFHLTNGGVPFAVADAAGRTVADLRRSKISRKDYSTELNIQRVKSGRDAPLSVRITRLSDGYVLGVQCSHACLDGNSFYTMVDNWGRICRGADFERPVLDPSLLPAPEPVTRKDGMRFALDNGWTRLSILKFFGMLPLLATGILAERTGAFRFSAGAVDRLKRDLSERLGAPCSANVALSALLSKMCMRLSGLTGEAACRQVTVADGRLHLAGVPAAYAGNASALIATPPFPGDASVEEIARVIRGALEPMLRTPSPELRRNVVVAMTMFPLGLPAGHVEIAGMYSRRPTVFQVNNFSKMPVYGVDFGAGGPARAVPHDLADPVLIWPAHPSQGGVEVYFGGAFAHGIGRRKAGDDWLEEMRKYS